MSLRITLPTALALIGIDRGFRYGFELIEASGLSAGTVYPILRRLEEAGCVSGAWEPVARSREEGRPPRRYYRLTQAGEALLESALARYPAIAGVYGEPSPKRA
jgi:PadR family transcriptional regulator, regulatory protein PadR